MDFWPPYLVKGARPTRRILHPPDSALDIEPAEVYKHNRARFERPAQSAPSERSRIQSEQVMDVIQMLQHEIPGLLAVNPQGGKIARAAAVSPLIEAGNVYLPHPDYAPWVNDFVEECAAFPNGAHDDQVDAMTQALLRWLMTPPPQEIVYICDPVRISPV